MATKLAFEGRCPERELKAESVVDHGKAAGREHEALAVSAGDIFARGRGTERSASVSRDPLHESLGLAPPKRVEQVAGDNETARPPLGKPLPDDDWREIEARADQTKGKDGLRRTGPKAAATKGPEGHGVAAKKAHATRRGNEKRRRTSNQLSLLPRGSRESSCDGQSRRDCRNGSPTHCVALPTCQTAPAFAHLAQKPYHVPLVLAEGGCNILTRGQIFDAL